MAKKKKKRARFIPIKITSPTELVNGFNPFNAFKELTIELARIEDEVDYERKQIETAFLNKLVKRFTNTAGSKILDETYNDPKKLLKQLEKYVTKESKKIALEQSVNDAYLQMNRGELLAAKASGVRTVKMWITQFDSKVRGWHDAVNHQTRKLKDTFTVPHPNGVDQLKAPKIPPISVENFINCRCFVRYEVVKKD